jgi:hypothetical protein
MAIARVVGIDVVAKPASARGVSGMSIRNDFVIAYATHIEGPTACTAPTPVLLQTTGTNLKRNTSPPRS